MPLCCLVGASKVLEGDDLGQIEKRARDGGNRNAIDLGAVIGMDLSGAVHRDSRPATAPSTGSRNVDRRPIGLPEIPERSRVAMTEQGALAAGKYGSHPVPLAIEWADRINATVHAPKPAISHTSAGRRSLNPQGGQLPKRHHTVLAGREAADDRVKNAHPRPFEGGG